MDVRRRALLAALFTIGFYGIILALVAALLTTLVEEWLSLRRPSTDMALILIGVGALVISAAPTSARISIPGTRLEPGTQPRLRAELTEIATRAGVPAPADIHLILEANGGVLYRGGILGIGGRRTLVLGLPLLQLMRVSELRALMIHELGHYGTGESRLAPWIYQCRENLGPVLEPALDLASLVRLPFHVFGRLFLRVTATVASNQELAADQLAARLVGSQPTISSLNSLEGASIAFQTYWNEEVVPVLSSGFRPPVMEGLIEFVGVEAITASINRQLHERLAHPERPSYDRHPPLAERVATLRSLPAGPDLHGEPLAISLVDFAAQLEADLLGTLAELPLVRWEEVGMRILVPRWENLTKDNAGLLRGMSGGSLPELARDAERLGRSCVVAGQRGSKLSDTEARRTGLVLLGSALGLVLARHSWWVDARPGSPAYLRRGNLALDPFNLVRQLADGELSEAGWQRESHSLGIRGSSLVA